MSKVKERSVTFKTYAERDDAVTKILIDLFEDIPEHRVEGRLRFIMVNTDKDSTVKRNQLVEAIQLLYQEIEEN